MLDRRVFGSLVRLEAEMPGFLAELLSEFREGCVRRLDVMRKAVTAGSSEELAFAAHGMRGSCGTLGAKGMERLAERIEEACPGTDAGLASLVQALAAEYERVGRALDEAVKEALSASGR